MNREPVAPQAGVRTRVMIASIAFIALGLAAWATHRAVVTIETSRGNSGLSGQFLWAFWVIFALLAWNTTLSYFELPARKLGIKNQSLVNKLNVVIAVPAYNEDPDALKASVISMLQQTRKPQKIHVVDDGSKKGYGNLPEILKLECEFAGVEFQWERKENGGKRQAQTKVFSTNPQADVFVTVDSDSLLEKNALHEVLKPLADPRVGSVAGIVVALNNTRNLLARVTDLIFVSSQLTERSAFSAMGSVLVNSGPLAAYRAEIIRRNLPGYTSETFMGHRVEFSDDSMLTLYGLAEGYKAVQQPTAFVFSLMPETFYHHRRQYLRWMRGSTIRSVWRFRYLPLNSYAYWGHFMRWFQMIATTVLFVAVFLHGVSVDVGVIPYLLGIPLLIGYASSLRYLQIWRSDESKWSQLLTVVMSPLATFWGYTVLRYLRWYGMFTCWKTGWGTRQTVEVTLNGTKPVESTPVVEKSEIDKLLAMMS